MGISKKISFLSHSRNKFVRVLEGQSKSNHLDGNFVYVLGSGYKFTGKSVLMSFCQSKFLLNCSPGTSRVLSEHKGKARNLSAILATRPLWENIGGLPSILLRLNDTKSADCSVFGFPSLDNMLRTARNFLHDPHSKMIAGRGYYTDEEVNMVQIKLGRQDGYKRVRRESEVNEDSFEDSVNVFAYILKTIPPKDRTLDIEKMLEKGITPGGQVVDLMNGKNITLSNGDVLTLADVVKSSKANLVVVIDCPEEDYLKSVELNKSFQQSQTDSQECNTTVIHFSPPSVMNSPRYIAWMKNFSKSTIHLVVNETSLTDGLVSLRYRQRLLSLVHPGLFPALKDTGYYYINAKHHTSRNVDCLKHSQTEPFQESEKRDWIQEEPTDDTNTEEKVKGSPLWLSKWKGMEDMNVYEARSGTRVSFRPFEINRNSELLFDESLYNEFKSLLPEDIVNKVRKRFLEVGVDLSKPLKIQADYENTYPRVIFLGTVSKADSKDRNVSGILLRISKDSSIIMDCGEGTHAQIYRLFGDEAPEIFRTIDAVYISHLHCDHHLGLTDIIRQRVKAFGDTKPSPLILLATSHIERWLHFTKRYFPEEQRINVIHLHGLLINASREYRLTAMKAMDQVYSRTGLLKIQTLRVNHCNEAYAVAFEHVDGWKITYSGDCMFNSRLKEIDGKNGENFADAASKQRAPHKGASGFSFTNQIQINLQRQGSDLLIHEATYDDGHRYLALKNRHSTVSQAIESGRSMNAKFTILTHLSQRYSVIPSVDLTESVNFSFAFDFMQVPLRYCHHLPILHKLYSYLSDTDLDEDTMRVEEIEGQQKRSC